MEEILEMNPSLLLRLKVPVELQGEICKFVGRHKRKAIFLWKNFALRLNRQRDTEVVIPTVRGDEWFGRPTFVVTYVGLWYLTVRTTGSRIFCAEKSELRLTLYQDELPAMTVRECRRRLRNTAFDALMR